MVDDVNILGWDCLYAYVGVGYATVTKWIKLYGFPQPGRVLIRPKTRISCWAKSDIDLWISNNKELVDNGVRNSALFYKKGE